LVWKGEKNGKYYVRNAYQICTENILNTYPNHWKSIWNIKALTKVKNLVWKVLCGCFSTCARLVSKGVICHIEYVVCNEDFEDFVHALFTCLHATQVWCGTNLWNITEHTLSSYVESTMWSLWKCKHFKLWQQVRETKVVECVMHMLEDWKLTHEMRTNVKTIEAQPQLRPSCTPLIDGRDPHQVDIYVKFMLLSLIIIIKLA